MSLATMFSSRLIRTIPSIAAATRSSPQFARPINQRLFHSTPRNMVVHKVKTAEEFKQVVASNDNVLVDCFAEWCGPCKAIAPILEKTSESAEFKDAVHFVKFDVDELPELSQQLGVRAMPTFLFFKKGEKADEVVGANPPALLQVMRKHIATEGPRL